MRVLLFALSSIIISVAAQFLLKVGMSSPTVKQSLDQPIWWRLIVDVLFNKFILLGFVLYGLGALVWLKVLSEWDVSKAYPLVGAGFALTALVGFMLGESISSLRILGILLICQGVWLISSNT